MSFTERYISSINTSDLRDDERHHATEPLVASGLADRGSGALLGSLLSRVKFAGGTHACAARADHLKSDLERSAKAGRAAGETAEQVAERIEGLKKLYSEAELALDANLAELLRCWTEIVIGKGTAREWLKIKHAWDIAAAHAMYRKIAHASIAYWIGGNCEACNGAKVTTDQRTCKCCTGTGRAPIQGGRMETDLVKDMISELEGIFQSHSARASKMLRRAG